MQLPFTTEQFFDVFAAYNAALWPVLLALWITSAIVAVLLLSARRPTDRSISALLAAHGMWSALAYHAVFFARINPAAWLFAALFLAQAMLLVWLGVVRGRLSFAPQSNAWTVVGFVLVAYSLLYPVINAVQHATWSRIPAFGVPCPTTIFTAGLLLLGRGGSWRLSIVPVIWSAIGGSAASLFGVQADYVLPIAGVLLAIFTFQKRSPRALREARGRNELPLGTGPAASSSLRHSPGIMRKVDVVPIVRERLVSIGALKGGPSEVTPRCAAILILLLAAAGTPAAAQTASARSGVELYKVACAACHGADGRGTMPTLLAFDTPVPDFTDCSFSTVEPDADWMAVSHDGGPARAFDRRMPAFGDALTDDDLQRVLDHIRGFCASPAWPRGELNMPRPLVTEKAFPENEAVLSTTVNTTGPGEIGNELLYEQRLGARSQYEVVVPLVVQERDAGGWNRGLGDVAFAVKHVFAHSLERGHILSAAGELIFPTGKESAGLGSGVTIFEPFVAFGQLLPADSFVQVQAGAELPFDTDRAGREAFWRVAIGKSFTQGRFGRSWSPMVEWLAARGLEEGATVHWDVVPQMQVTLNRRQHIMIDVGVRVPVNQRAGRSTQLLTYFLWDWFDGGLLDGWR